MTEQVVRIDKRLLESDAAGELYVTAAPRPGAPAEEQAEEMFRAVAEVLRAAGARIFQERVFGTERALAAVDAIRARAYGGLADGVAPSRLVGGEGLHGELAGVQVHAVRSPRRLQLLAAGGAARGRALRVNGCVHVALAGLSAGRAGPAPAQARAMFDMAAGLLGQAGGDMHSVARTWLWLDDILSWYRQFNRVRSRFFAEHGLTDGRPERARLPASTGIGMGPPGRPACALDVLAVVGAGGSLRFFQAAGKQRSPFAYGSAFSRAARAPGPCGETVFISGTAAVDRTGATRYLGKPGPQIEMALDNLRAILAEQRCCDQDVVQAIAYCKTPEVEAVWRRRWLGLPWPCVTVIADICRQDLLFEIEATACPGARKV